MGRVALDRINWINLAKPPKYRVSALGLTGETKVSLERYARSEADMANYGVLRNMMDSSILTVGTDGSFVKRDGKVLSSFAVLPTGNPPYFQSTLEASGGIPT